MIKIIITFFILFCFSFQSSYSQQAAYQLDSLSKLSESPGDSLIIIELEKVANIARIENDDTTLVVALIYLSDYLFSVDNLFKFEQVVAESVDVVKSDSIFNSWITSTVTNNIALLESIRGNFHKAADHYLGAINIEKSNSNDSAELVILYSNLAVNYEQIGDFDKSLVVLEQAIKYFPVTENAYDTISLSRILSITGWSAFSKGDLGLARQYYNQSRTLYDQLPQKEKTTYYNSNINNLQRFARLRLSKNKLEDAKVIIDKLKKLHSKSNYRSFRTSMIAADYQLLIGNIDKSLALSDEAINNLQINQKSNQRLSFPQKAYHGKSNAFYIQDNFDLALSTAHFGLVTLDTSISNDLSLNPSLKSFYNYPVAIDLLLLKARSAWRLYEIKKEKSNWEICRKTFMDLCFLMAEMKRQFLADQSKYFVAQKAQPIYEEIMDVFVSQYNKSPTEQLLDNILYVMQSNKSIILFDGVKRKMDLLSSDIPTVDINKLIELRNKKSFYGEILSKEATKATPDQNTIDKLKTKLFNIDEDKEIHNKEMLGKYPDYVKQMQQQQKIPTKEQIWNEMKNDEALLLFFKGASEYFLIEILKGEISIRTIDSTLIDKVKHFQSLVSQSPKSQKDFQEFNKISQDVGEKLLTNIKEKGIETIHIIPDGIFNLIPFEAMTLDNAYVVEKWNVSYQLSLQQYIDAKTKKRKKSNATVFCLAPDFSEIENINDKSLPKGLQSLPFAKEETQFLSGLFESKVKADNTTYTTDLIEHAKDYSIIHLATHAIVHERDAMLSEIYFNDGPLTIFDIQELEIETEFVMLSACNTSVGTTKEGEGVISLSRGVFLAGVKSVQSSLWPLDDYASSEIVKEMYMNLKSGQKKSEALKNAKVTYLSKSDNRRKHPYYWSGLVHIGNDNPLFYTFNYSFLLIFLTFCALVIGLFFYFRRT